MVWTKEWETFTHPDEDFRSKITLVMKTHTCLRLRVLTRTCPHLAYLSSPGHHLVYMSQPACLHQLACVSTPGVCPHQAYVYNDPHTLWVSTHKKHAPIMDRCHYAAFQSYFNNIHTRNCSFKRKYKLLESENERMAKLDEKI